MCWGWMMWWCQAAAWLPAPDTLPAPLWEQRGAFVLLAADELGQAYAVTPRNELIKYDPNGVELFRYNNNTLGELAAVDVANPFNLLLYYPAHQQVVILDRTLNVWAGLDLRQTGLLNAATVGLSRDNNLWVYDDWDYRLKLLNPQGQELLRSDDLRLLLGTNEAPAQVLAQRERVYLAFAGRGVAEFTNFGQFEGWLPMPADAADLHAVGGQLCYRTADDGYRLWPGSANPPLPMPDVAGVKQARLLPHRLYLLTPTGIIAYTLP